MLLIAIVNQFSLSFHWRRALFLFGASLWLPFQIYSSLSLSLSFELMPLRFGRCMAASAR